MHFSVFPSIPTLNTFLPLNGVALTPWRLPNIHGQCLHRVFRLAPIFLRNALARELRELSLENSATIMLVIIDE